MALSDMIKKIEDSPRSTKVAVLAVGVAIAASTIAVYTVLNQADSSPEPASVAKAVTADQSPETQAAPVPTFTPVPTPSPIPTSIPTPSPTPEPVVEEPTPAPTATPVLPTPTPEVNDYYVVLHQGILNNDGEGVVEYYASYPFDKSVGGSDVFDNEDFFLEYLRKEGVITSKEKNAYFNGEPIKISLLSISNATYKLFKNDGYNASRLSLRAPNYLLHYADDSSLDSKESVSTGQLSLEGDSGYVMINDGKISVSAVDSDGNTTTVNVEGVGAKDLLDYWLSQNRITIQQVNQYGQTGELQFSLKDGVDLFDFASSSDGGSSFSLDKESRDIIANEILPLFKFGD